MSRVIILFATAIIAICIIGIVGIVSEDIIIINDFISSYPTAIINTKLNISNQSRPKRFLLLNKAIDFIEQMR